MKPEMTSMKRARPASSVVAPDVCGDLEADARASKAKARRLRRKQSYAKWTQHLWSGWTGCWHGWAASYEHVKHLQQDSAMPEEPLDILLHELGPAAHKKSTPFSSSQAAWLKELIVGQAAWLGETFDARFEEVATEITALRSELNEVRQQQSSFANKNEMLECSRKEFSTMRTDIVAQLRQEFPEASPQKPTSTSSRSSPSKQVHFEPRTYAPVAELDAVQKERAVVVKQKTSGLAAVSKTVGNMRKEMQAVKPLAQSSSWAAWSKRPPTLAEESSRVPEATADFGKRLKLLRGYRAENGQAAQICLLCPKIVMRGEPYDTCCEYCFHEVLPLISPEKARTCRQDLEVLLTASQWSEK